MNWTGHWFMSSAEAYYLPDRNYLDFVLSRIRNAESSILASIFIVDVIGDPHPGPVAELLDELNYAGWRGVDTRLVIGMTQTYGILLANLTSFNYLKELGFPVRLYADERGSGNHSKYLVVDRELVICGSHNWTQNALSRNCEDSVAIRSADAAQRLENSFERMWEQAREVIS